MQHISRAKAESSGFTLIEILIISPIVILVIGAFIGFIVVLTGDSLKLNVKNTGIFDTQTSLDDMESAIKLSTNFLTTTGALTSPQGKNNGVTAFTNSDVVGQPDVLILRSPVTDKNALDPTRTLIYNGSGACDAVNSVTLYKTVFFVDSGSLFKRTILESGATCKTPWQRNSCKASLVAANQSVCKASDEKLMDNVTDVDVKYYTTSSDTVPKAANLAATASTVEVNITFTNAIAGATITYTGTLKATSTNFGAVVE